jgi:hypothetical protein
VRVLDVGACEPLKAGVHAGLGLLAVICCAYNGAAYLRRREPNLRRNVLFYAVVVAVEIAHVHHHRRRV